MSYIKAKDKVVELIERATPSYKGLTKFKCFDRPLSFSGGQPAPEWREYTNLEDLVGYEDATRVFQLYSEGLPIPLDIITGGVVGYYTTTMTLRIVYSVQSRGEFDNMIMSDYPIITDALLSISDWNNALENIVMNGGLVGSEFTDDDTDSIKGYIAQFVFDMDWAQHEC